MKNERNKMKGVEEERLREGGMGHHYLLKFVSTNYFEF